MAMVGRSHCQVLVPGCHHHDDHDAGDEDEYDNDSKAMRRMIDLEEVHTPFIPQHYDGASDDSDEDYTPVIIGVPCRGESKTKSGLGEAFGE